MNRQTLKPKDKSDWLRMRAEDITSTEVSALFGISPYLTEFELWHRKKSGDVIEITATDRMLWGTRLESAIARGIAEDRGWVVEPMKDYTRLTDLKIGSSFDYMIAPDKILEIKNVDSMAFKDGWSTDDDGNLEAPLHIEMQVQHQMLVSGFKEAYIAALVGGNYVAVIHREADEAIHKQIITKVNKFWQSIESNQAPQPDFQKDYEFIKYLNQYATEGKLITPNNRIDLLVAEYKQCSDEIKLWSEKQEAAKAELITLLGDAEKCVGNSYTISAGMVKESQINYTRKPYRSFKISYRKGK